MDCSYPSYPATATFRHVAHEALGDCYELEVHGVTFFVIPQEQEVIIETDRTDFYLEADPAAYPYRKVKIHVKRAGE